VDLEECRLAPAGTPLPVPSLTSMAAPSVAVTNAVRAGPPVARPRPLALIGAGALALTGLLAVIGLGVWAAGKYLVPGSPAITPSLVAMAPPAATAPPATTATTHAILPATRTPALPSATVSPTFPPLTMTPVPARGSTTVSDRDGMTLVYVPAGEFQMGSSAADQAAPNNEKPQRTVYLDAFWMDQTEVTNAMFAKFVEDEGRLTTAEKEGCGTVTKVDATYLCSAGVDWLHPRGPASNLEGLDNHPVVQVSWYDASAYCEWAGRRLPTEAEWEKAARGTDGRTFPWGNRALTGKLLNFADKYMTVDWADKATDDGYPFTAPVGSYPAGASPYGALDLAGNVEEWVADWYDEAYYSRAPDRNPPGPTSGELRVVRGGAWIGGEWSVRVISRKGEYQNNRNDIFGFRCARSP